MSLVILFSLSIICIELIHHYNFGHFASYGLHVDSLNEDANIGIPGQTKMYWARVTNFSFLPVKITGCDYITDAMMPGSEIPYAVQRWNASSKTWETIVPISKEGFCTPVPLSTTETKLVSNWLLPTLSMRIMDGEATGARVPFRKGDMARFVIFTRIENGIDWQNAIPSVPFHIQDDVIREENDSFRIQH